MLDTDETSKLQRECIKIMKTLVRLQKMTMRTTDDDYDEPIVYTTSLPNGNYYSISESVSWDHSSKYMDEALFYVINLYEKETNIDCTHVRELVKKRQI
jgi:hypothetical protein